MKSIPSEYKNGTEGIFFFWPFFVQWLAPAGFAWGDNKPSPKEVEKVSISHAAYNEEKKHLTETIEWIEKSISELAARERQIYKSARWASMNYAQENSQEDIELDLNKQIYAGVVERLHRLERARSHPYFARIDFCEEGNPKQKRLYIGRSSLLQGDQGPKVIDWRAPAANLYYEGRLGVSSYQSPDGEIKGELQLKRQLSIAEGELKKILDIDVTADDELLQDYLGINADHRLKDIVVSIQTEQNKIIRAGLDQNLIVQGVAGSGKTTVALHRIAYLLYNYPEYKEESFMIIAPNRLFLDYISEVLPELGADKVKQTTFTDLILEMLEEKVKVKESHEKLASIIEHRSNQGNHAQMLKEVSKVKSAAIFQEILDGYLKKTEASLLPAGDFGFADGTMVVCPAEEVQNLYKTVYKDWPLYQRVELISQYFKKKLAKIRKEYIEKCQDECVAQISQIKAAMEDGEDRRRFIAQVITKKEARVRMMEDFAKNGLRKYVKQVKRLTALQLYQKFLQDKKEFIALAQGKVQPEVAEVLLETTLRNLKNGAVESEDLAPLLYLKYRTVGVQRDQVVKQIVIDEAQDYSIFQYLVLKAIFKDATFTILGDLSQGIYYYQGIENWEDLCRQAFPERDSRILVLNNSYRATIEITEAASKLSGFLEVPETYKAIPVIRHGKKVQVIKKENQSAIAEEIAKQVSKAQEEKYKSIAIVCKNKQESQTYAKLLEDQMCERGGVAPSLLTGREDAYTGGVVVLPAYLVKGLEFDVVFIADAGSHNYQVNSIDARLLYVSMTRPLHRLYIYYSGELSGLLS